MYGDAFASTARIADEVLRPIRAKTDAKGPKRTGGCPARRAALA